MGNLISKPGGWIYGHLVVAVPVTHAAAALFFLPASACCILLSSSEWLLIKSALKKVLRPSACHFYTLMDQKDNQIFRYYYVLYGILWDSQYREGK